MSAFSDGEPLDISLLEPPARQTTESAPKPTPVLEYKTPEHVKRRQEGVVIIRAAWWGVRKFVFCAALAMLASSLGLTIQGRYDGPGVMGFSAFVIGLYIPVVRWKRRKEDQ